MEYHAENDVEGTGFVFESDDEEILEALSDQSIEDAGGAKESIVMGGNADADGLWSNTITGTRTGTGVNH